MDTILKPDIPIPVVVVPPAAVDKRKEKGDDKGRMDGMDK